MATSSIRPNRGPNSTRSTTAQAKRGGKDGGLPQPTSVILLDPLGSGSYATVYKGIIKATKEVVAVKCIERSRIKSKTREDNLITEIKVMKKLDHTHIVRLLDFEWNQDHIFLIMEYCDGGDLCTFIRSRQCLNESIVRRFLRQLAHALQYLKSKGIAHMDLKPQNLLLSSQTKPLLKIGDFGMAQLMKTDDQSLSYRGSPLYMAPEIMLGQPYDSKVDLWSVGIILYEALFGAAPFASETLEELQLKVIEGKPIEIPTVPELSKNCHDLLERLLKRNPDERISFEQFFDHPFCDLEHIPSSDSLEKARNLLKIATGKDNEGNIKSAINYYCQALEYFTPAIEYEQDVETKQYLKKMMEEYMNRAEVLKDTLKLNRPLTKERNVKLLDKFQEELPALKEALEFARRADKLEQHHLYDRALELYTEAIENLLPIIETEKGEVKKLMAAEVQLYLHRAEELKVLMEKHTVLNRSNSLPSSSVKQSVRTIAEKTCPVQ